MRIELSYKPWPHQKSAHSALKRFNVFIWHRRAGKTEFCLNELILAAATSPHPDGSYAYVAPKRNQGKTVAWARLKRFASQIPHVAFNETELQAKFPNGASVRIFGADDPDALRGIHLDGCVLDEVADMKPRVWSETIRPALSDKGRHGWVIFIGTPRGHDFLYKVFTQARASDDWHADLRRASETGVIDAAELAAAREDMSPAQYAQEYECDFGASAEDAILSFDEVASAVGRVDLPDDDGLGVSEDWSDVPRILGVDVARYGSDRSCIIGRQGRWSGRPKTFSQVSTMELADAVAESIRRWSPDAVFIDAGAAGGGVIDRLRQLNFRNVVGVQFGSSASDPGAFRNKRCEMWARMAAWIRDGGSIDEDFPVDELFAPRVDYRDAGGRMNLESKESMRNRGLASPDVADALALTFYTSVLPSRMALGSGGRAATLDPEEWL